MDTKRFYLDLQKAIDIAESKTLAQPIDVLLKYIEKYYNAGDGEIVPIHKHQSACDAASTFSYMNYNFVGSSLNKPVESDEKHNVVIRGILKNDVQYADNDPYETAGGYIGGVATKGTPCTVVLGYDYTGFGFVVFADVNILQDNYNNNFFGVSTGGGNKSYEMGKRVENKRLKAFSHIGHSLWDMVEIEAIDCEKIEKFIHSQK